jgi:hypothetical protein
MPHQQEPGNEELCSGGSTDAGKEIEPKQISIERPEPANRAVPIGTPISPATYRKLKEQAKTQR